MSVGGQSENIDLIISRLQNELVRSQEISTDLSFLKHGLGELERAIFINVDETESKNKDSANLNGQPSSDTDPAWINYEKLLEQRDQVRKDPKPESTPNCARAMEEEEKVALGHFHNASTDQPLSLLFLLSRNMPQR